MVIIYIYIYINNNNYFNICRPSPQVSPWTTRARTAAPAAPQDLPRGAGQSAPPGAASEGNPWEILAKPMGNL